MECQLRLSGTDVFTQLVVVNIIAEPLMSLVDETKLEDKLSNDDETPGCKVVEDLKMDLDGKELVGNNERGNIVACELIVLVG